MKCYAAFAKEETTRRLGSSGGIYPVLAKGYVKCGGIVYASVYDENLHVKFCRIDTSELLLKSCSSKYMQSRVGDTFKKLSDDLKSGKKVLFCGTPCQAQGLNKYLSQKMIDRSNLLIIDFICHGVPSEDVFSKYMNGKYGSTCTSVNMRNKDTGWNWGGFAWKMQFADDSEITVPQKDVTYMKGFISNIYLRPSCYGCSAKKSSAADITLGDFWGISNVDPSIPARYGVSCVIVRTEKGQTAFQQSINEIEHYDVKYTDILNGNRALEESPKRPLYRRSFFKKMAVCQDDDMEKLILEATSPSTFQKVLNKVYQRFPDKRTNASDLKKNNEAVIFTCKEKCCACSSCVSVCPVNAINMKKDKEGFFYPVIDASKCVNCDACKKTCPM